MYLTACALKASLILEDPQVPFDVFAADIPTGHCRSFLGLSNSDLIQFSLSPDTINFQDILADRA